MEKATLSTKQNHLFVYFTVPQTRLKRLLLLTNKPTNQQTKKFHQHPYNQTINRFALQPSKIK